MTLNGQVAVVTGASRGIGRGIADVLAQAGMRVYGTGRTVMASALDASVIRVECDGTDSAAVDALFDRVQQEAGLLANRCGVLAGWPVGTLTEPPGKPWLPRPGLAKRQPGRDGIIATATSLRAPRPRRIFPLHRHRATRALTPLIGYDQLKQRGQVSPGAKLPCEGRR